MLRRYFIGGRNNGLSTGPKSHRFPGFLERVNLFN